jgi:hypothetical protein
MPELKIVTEVAGRVCTLAAAVGARVGGGDDVVIVEAIKWKYRSLRQRPVSSNRSWLRSTSWLAKVRPSRFWKHDRSRQTTCSTGCMSMSNVSRNFEVMM